MAKKRIKKQCLIGKFSKKKAPNLFDNGFLLNNNDYDDYDDDYDNNIDLNYNINDNDYYYDNNNNNIDLNYNINDNDNYKLTKVKKLKKLKKVKKVKKVINIRNINMKYKEINTTFLDVVNKNYSLNKIKYLCLIKPKKEYQNFFFENIKKYWGLELFDEKAINYIFCSSNFNLISYYLIDKKINISNDAITNSIKNNNLELLKYYYEKNDFDLKIEHLETACNYCDIDTIKFFLQNKVIPNSTCWNFCLNKSINIKNINKNNAHNLESGDDSDSDFGLKIKNYKYDSKMGILNPNIINKEINDLYLLKLISSSGYLIMQNDFYNLIKNGIYITSYKNYNLELNEDIKNLCNKICFYPYDEIKMDMNGYKKVLEHVDSCEQIVKIGNHFKIKPDLDCLKKACENIKLDRLIIYYINTHKIIPDFECLGKVLKNEKIKLAQIFYKLINKYDKQNKQNKQKNDDTPINILLNEDITCNNLIDYKEIKDINLINLDEFNDNMNYPIDDLNFMDGFDNEPDIFNDFDYNNSVYNRKQGRKLIFKKIKKVKQISKEKVNAIPDENNPYA